MGIGVIVFFMGVLVFFFLVYVLYIVFDSWLVVVFFGVVWGLMIFNLDCYIVLSMKSKCGFFGNFGMVLLCLVFVVLLVFVIFKLLELKIFEKEINVELLVMEQEKFKEQEDCIQECYVMQIDGYEVEVVQL